MKIAMVAGIPIRLHWSFLLIGAGYLAGALWMRGWVAAIELVGLLLALFASVILHELGHALAARSFGIRTAHITLYPFGGIAAISRMPTDPRQELVIALAGPLVNFLLVAVFAMAWGLTGWWAMLAIGVINLMMALFNLVPAFPMDGGRVLRALLATQMGWVRASRLAMSIGQVFAWGFIAVAVLVRHPSLALVGAFLLFAIALERRRLVQILGSGWRPVPRFVGERAR